MIDIIYIVPNFLIRYLIFNGKFQMLKYSQISLNYFENDEVYKIISVDTQ